MLHAIAQNKAGCLTRFHGGRRRLEGLPGAGLEDSITSTFLGPLDFMPAEHSWIFWRELFLLTNPAADIPEASPCEALYELWRSRTICDNKYSCEPDALLTYSWPSGEKRFLLLEFKWDSGLSPPKASESQLHEQWEHFLSPDERRNATHIFVAKYLHKVRQIVERNYIWNPSQALVLCTWDKVRTALISINKQDAPVKLKKWANLSSIFLENLKVRSFNGLSFATQSLDELTFPPGTFAGILFYKPFAGLTELDTPDIPLLIPSTIFFTIGNP